MPSYWQAFIYGLVFGLGLIVAAFAAKLISAAFGGAHFPL